MENYIKNYNKKKTKNFFINDNKMKIKKINTMELKSL